MSVQIVSFFFAYYFSYYFILKKIRAFSRAKMEGTV